MNSVTDALSLYLALLPFPFLGQYLSISSVTT